MDKADIIIYNSIDGKANVALYARDGSVWLNQKQLAELFDTSAANISMHISNILKEKELSAESVVKNYLTTAPDEKNYNVMYYSLDMIIAIGFRVRSKRGTQFRAWAGQNLKEYMVKGFVVDDERLKNPDNRPDYFDEMLERIRDIRASEKRFYQKIRDLFALCSDYDSSDKATQMFFAETQNKLLFAVTQNTAAEIITSRIDADKQNAGLTAWKGTIVRKQDIYIAKNYLTEDEIDTLNRLTVIFLETAELRAKRQIETTMDYWRKNVNQIIESNQFTLLKNKGAISAEEMRKIALGEYEKFNDRRKKLDAIKADEQDIKEIEQLEKNIKEKRGQ